VGYQSAPIGSDDLSGANRGPPHTVNPTLRAGDILIMSECTTHGVVPWCAKTPIRFLLLFLIACPGKRLFENSTPKS